jgi:hypothetical protein
VVLTGNGQLTHAVMERLPNTLAARTVVERTEATDAVDEHTIARAAAAGVDALERRRQSECVAQAIDGAFSGGRGALSVEATKAALAERCVQDLYFTERLAQQMPDELEVMIAIAFEQSARSEVVRDPATAERLDREGGGIGALLRFPAPIRNDPTALTEAWRAVSNGAHPD